MPVTDADVERWLREDLGHHDVSNDVPGTTTGRLVATEPGVAAGTRAAERVFAALDCDVDRRVEAGVALDAGDTILTVTGPAKKVLRGERVAANIAGHASGIATRTREAVAAAGEAVGDDAAIDTPPRIAATRKTTPGLRGVEKRAVAAGGGDTHRLDCSHMVMVKENHIAELGLERAVERFRDAASFATQIEVEVERPADARTAVETGADAILFDNLPPAAVAEGVETVREADPAAGTERAVITEASGGITQDDVPAYARTGVDVISMGRLTHSAPALDLSFRTGD